MQQTSRESVLDVLCLQPERQAKLYCTLLIHTWMYSLTLFLVSNSFPCLLYCAPHALWHVWFCFPFYYVYCGLITCCMSCRHPFTTRFFARSLRLLPACSKHVCQAVLNSMFASLWWNQFCLSDLLLSSLLFMVYSISLSNNSCHTSCSLSVKTHLFVNFSSCGCCLM